MALCQESRCPYRYRVHTPSCPSCGLADCTHEFSEAGSGPVGKSARSDILYRSLPTACPVGVIDRLTSTAPKSTRTHRELPSDKTCPLGHFVTRCRRRFYRDLAIFAAVTLPAPDIVDHEYAIPRHVVDTRVRDSIDMSMLALVPAKCLSALCSIFA
jgi:hypothetical protein